MNLKNKLYSYEGMVANIGDAKVNCLFTKRARDNNLLSDSAPHLHFGAEIHYIFEGDALLITDDNFYDLESNSICVIPPKLSHAIKTDSVCRGFATVVNLEKYDKHKGEKAGKSEYEYYNKIYSSFENVLIIKDVEKILVMIKEFLDVLHEDKCDSEHLAEALLKAVIILLSRNISLATNSHDNSTNEVGEKQKLEVIASELEHYIMNNYCNDLSIESVAKHIGYSPAYTGRIIKKSFGMTYFELVMKLKMAYAKREILETDRSFFEIAESIGYNSYNGFTVGFKKYFGKTPEQMRKEYKK